MRTVQDKPIRRAAARALAVGLAVTAAVSRVDAQVAGWVHEESAGIHSASFTGDSSRLEFRCKGGSLEVVYYLEPSIVDPVLKGLTSAVFGVTVDNSDQVLWVNAKLIPVGNAMSIGAGGAAADQIVRLIAVAENTVAASLMTTQPSNATPQYNRTVFPVAGAAAAIKAAYTGCGIRF